jgi:hypothetical protein
VPVDHQREGVLRPVNSCYDPGPGAKRRPADPSNSGEYMDHIGWVNGIGYLASLLVFGTFCMKTMLPLRGHLFRLVVQRAPENERRWRASDSAVRS